MKIPKLIHHVWPGDDPINRDYTANLESFKKVFKGYETKIWTGEKCRAFLDKYFHKYREYFDKANNYALKSDLMRYLILEQIGGIYSDFDVTILDPLLTTEVESNNALFVTETILDEAFVEETASYKIRQGIPEHPIRIANYFMASIPNHPVWGKIRQEMDRRLHLKPVEIYDVLFITGPDVVSTVVNREPRTNLRLIDKRTSDQYLFHEKHGTTTWKTHLKASTSIS